MDPQFPVTWTLASDAGGLALTWHIENHTAASVWLLDTGYEPVVDGYQPTPDRITVIASTEAPDLVRFVRGHLRAPPGQGVAVEYTPVARALAAGAGADGSAHVSLPLQPWHPYYVLSPFKKAPKRAVLDLGVLVGDPPDGVTAWETRYKSTADGSALQIPTLGYVIQRQRMVRGEVKDLP